MISYHPILVQKKPGQAHREVKVTINWDGISQEDLIILARDALLYNLQYRLKKDEGPMPEQETILAKDAVHHELPCMVQFQPQPLKIKLSKDMEAALRNLSPDELEELLG